MSTKTILIAEDERIVSLGLKMLLQNNNYTVIDTVSTGEDLISSYKSKKPDLIISDLMLKGKVSGMDAIIEIRKIDSTPIIIISGYLRPKLEKLASSLSNCKVLEKPFEQSDVLYFADKILGLHI